MHGEVEVFGEGSPGEGETEVCVGVDRWYRRRSDRGNGEETREYGGKKVEKW